MLQNFDFFNPKLMAIPCLIKTRLKKNQKINELINYYLQTFYKKNEKKQ
jgi:hypothetical protein